MAHSSKNRQRSTAVGAVGDERSRILSANARLSLSDGFSRLTVPRICAQAGISRRAFKVRFADARDSFLESVEALVALTAAQTRRAARRGTGRTSTVEQATRAFCQGVARNPGLAKLCFVEVFASGREGLLRKERWVSLAAERAI